MTVFTNGLLKCHHTYLYLYGYMTFKLQVVKNRNRIKYKILFLFKFCIKKSTGKVFINNIIVYILCNFIWISSYTKALGSWWSWSYGSWIYNCLCNQWLTPLALWVRIALRRGVLDTTLWLLTGQWFSPGTPVSFTNKRDRHDITEILLKVALNTITITLIY